MIMNLIHKIRVSLYAAGYTLLANIAEGVHGDGNITKKVDAVQALRHVLVKIGSDADHVAGLGILADKDFLGVEPIGGRQAYRLATAVGE